MRSASSRYQWKRVAWCLAVAAITVSVRIAEAMLTTDKALYCAFEVVVRNPSGQAISGVPVALVLKHQTSVSETTTNEKGVARLCDSPLEPVDVVVGHDICGSVLVRNLESTWPRTARVFVTYVPNVCDHMAVVLQQRLLLRVLDEDGHPLSGARFDGHFGQGTPGASDVFGRIHGVVMREDKVEGFVLKEGFQPTRVSEVCRGDLELKIVLRKK